MEARSPSTRSDKLLCLAIIGEMGEDLWAYSEHTEAESIVALEAVGEKNVVEAQMVRWHEWHRSWSY